MTNKIYIELSINKHIRFDVVKIPLLNKLKNINENNLTALVAFMGEVNTKATSGIFKQANEFAAQGISNPTVLAAFTPLAQSATGAFTATGNGLEAVGSLVQAKAGPGITIDTSGISVTNPVGDLSTISNAPTSVVALLGPSTPLQTTSQTIIGAINEIKNTAETPAQVTNGSGTATVTSAEAIAGSDPAQVDSSHGLARLTTTNKTSVVDAVNELKTQAGSILPFGDPGSSLSGAIGNQPIAGYGAGTVSISRVIGNTVMLNDNTSDITGAIGNTALFGAAPGAFTISQAIGGIPLTTTDTTSLVAAINEVKDQIGSHTHAALQVTNDAGNGLVETNVALAGTNPATGAAGSGLNRLMTSDKTSVVDAINSIATVKDDAGGGDVVNVNVAIQGPTNTALGLYSLVTPVRSNLIASINSFAMVTDGTGVRITVNQALAGADPDQTDTSHGLARLTTSDKTSVVDAINEVKDQIGSHTHAALQVTNDAGNGLVETNVALAGTNPATGTAGSGLNRLTTTTKTSVVDALNELDGDIGVTRQYIGTTDILTKPIGTLSLASALGNVLPLNDPAASLSGAIGNTPLFGGTPGSPNLSAAIGGIPLTTNDKSSLTAAVNEVNAAIQPLIECPINWDKDSACSQYNNYVFFQYFFYSANQALTSSNDLISSNAVGCAQTANAGGYDVVCCDGTGWGANGNKCPKPNQNSVISRINTINNAVLNECPINWNQNNACSQFNNYVFFGQFYYTKNSILETTSNKFYSNAVNCAETANAGGYFIICCDGSEWATNTDFACPKVRQPTTLQTLSNLCANNPSQTLQFVNSLFDTNTVSGNNCLEFVAALSFVSSSDTFIQGVSNSTECISKVNQFSMPNNDIDTILQSNTALSGALKQDICKPYLTL